MQQYILNACASKDGGFYTAYFKTPLRVILLQYFCKYKNFKQLSLLNVVFRHLF